MTLVRPKRRVLMAAASVSALLAVAACGGGGEEEGTPQGQASPAVDFAKQGDIEVWQGKDVSGNFPKLVKQFNDSHPNGKVVFHELPDEADAQRQQMIQNTQIKNPKMAVISVDVVWTAEFAAKGYIEALPADQFPTEGFLPATVDSATYFNKLYAFPSTSDGGLLYYRKDLLDKYNLQPPTTFDEMKQACDTIKQGEGNSKLECFAGQYNKYEGCRR
jgi:multiple sugar transport system substrate-binding protein